MKLGLSDLHDAVNNFTHFKTSEYLAETKRVLMNTYHWKKYHTEMRDFDLLIASSSRASDRAYLSMVEDIDPWNLMA